MMIRFWMSRFAILLGCLSVGRSQSTFAQAPLPGPDDPVLAGYDLVSYHSLNPLDKGVRGSSEITYRYKGYLYYFRSTANRDAFIADPGYYLPAYGGFCAWGVAWEYPEDDWPWAADHMGPPCGPDDGWAIIDNKLYCSIFRHYQDDFNARSEEGIRLANQRWIGFYGSLSDGPMNNGCYEWNWHECFARSIYNPKNNGPGGTSDDSSNEIAGPDSNAPYIPGNSVVTWSQEESIMEGAVHWKWTLDNLNTSSPDLVVELVTDDISGADYLAFGAAEQLMQGVLVVCELPLNLLQEARAKGDGCRTYLGAGMGVSRISSENDPVQPQLLYADRNMTHAVLRFSINLLGCWSNPKVPARLLFARGRLSGGGDAQPHLNHPEFRHAVTGIELLSVVQGFNETEAASPEPTSPPLPDQTKLIPGAVSGETELLDGRVLLQYQEYEGFSEFVLTTTYDPDMYIGFGLADTVMTGVVLTCSDGTCHHWSGEGTNLYPIRDREWNVIGTETNLTHISYTLGIQRSNLGGQRVICALGAATSDSKTPIIHQAGDRAAFVIPSVATSSTGFFARTPYGYAYAFVSCLVWLLLN